jgi:hypothetical protein
LDALLPEAPDAREGKTALTVTDGPTYRFHADKLGITSLRKLAARIPLRITPAGPGPLSRVYEDGDAADTAITVYNEAARAADIIAAQIAHLEPQLSSGEDEANARRWRQLVCILRERAELTDVPKDQLTANLKETVNRIARGDYPAEHSPRVRTENQNEQDAADDMHASPLYAELRAALTEHYNGDKGRTLGGRAYLDRIQDDERILTAPSAGRGAPRIRKLQDALIAELRVSTAGGLDFRVRSRRERQVVCEAFTPTAETRAAALDL